MHDPISALLARERSLALARSARPDAPIVCEKRSSRRRVSLAPHLRRSARAR